MLAKTNPETNLSKFSKPFITTCLIRLLRHVTSSNPEVAATARFLGKVIRPNVA